MATKAKPRHRRYRVGQIVLAPFGATLHRARIIEDRGNIGVGGRQLLRIELLDQDPVAPVPDYEVAADDVEPA